ncbi:proline-rich membrane anchor 1 isoform X1 [Petromyzon marinus]|uniref:Proline-rich membrane anchor 1-like isoform X1 n=2 Tax=Petromyzon marinus TaxID=7757 RepID=A0AAJ7T7S7_PETMA|nr:proline-rich membrane anchor 1-like isoform X1 [Petromyzon marinus]
MPLGPGGRVDASRSLFPRSPASKRGHAAGGRGRSVSSSRLLPTVGMLAWDPRHVSWPVLSAHFTVAVLVAVFQVVKAEQAQGSPGGREFSRTESGGDSAGICQSLCMISPPPPLPPPPPLRKPKSREPPQLPLPNPTRGPVIEDSQWLELVVFLVVGGVILLAIILLVTICYKAIRRKPLHKEENGGNQAESAAPMPDDKTTEANNTVA